MLQKKVKHLHCCQHQTFGPAFLVLKLLINSDHIRVIMCKKRNDVVSIDDANQFTIQGLQPSISV